MIRAAKSSVNRRLWPRATQVYNPTLILPSSDIAVSVLTTAAISVGATTTHGIPMNEHVAALIVTKTAVRAIA